MKVSIISFAAAATVAASSFAGFTAIGRAPTSEHTQAQIFSNVYGGTFHQIGDDFFNGTITARRVDDGMSVTPPMSMARGTIGDTTDERWDGSSFSVRALAKWSMNTQTLSINDGAGTHDLFSSFGYGYNASGSANFNATGKITSFVRSGDSGTQSSITRNNVDGRDHMLTYEILGLAGVNDKVWVMFWEDLNRSAGLATKRTHSDYNDLVVEMRAAAVPLPAAAWAAIAVGGVGAIFRKRVRKIAGA
jgi:hypothetical protein